MKYSISYYLSRTGYGLLIVWIGIVGLLETDKSKAYVEDCAHLLKQLAVEFLSYDLDISALLSHSKSMAIFVYALYVVGGLFAFYGSKLSTKILMIGITLNILVCNNIMTITEENKKRIMGGIMKNISLLGGSYFIH